MSNTSTGMLMEACSICFSFLGTLEAPLQGTRLILCQSTARYGISSVQSLGSEVPIPSTAAQVHLKPALKVTLGKYHLLVLVEFSCTFHFEYDLGERFAQHYLT